MMTNKTDIPIGQIDVGRITHPITNYQLLIPLLTTLADDTLIMSQRLSEWTGHGPALEQDIAMTNIALDYLGQARMFYQYIAELKNSESSSLTFGEGGGEATEDSIAYLREANEYRNHLLVELPNGDWAQSILKIFFFATCQELLYQQLITCDDKRVAAIAEKSLKEVNYHLSWSRDWVLRLGDGTQESHERMINALDYVWDFTGELLEPINGEFFGIDYAIIKESWLKQIEKVFEEATLELPQNIPFQTGGLKGVHTEYLGYILADLQWMQRVYPNSEW